jgi:predicted nucleic acid-binding protein
VTFVDTSAIYAWADKGDPNHHPAIQRLEALLDRDEELVTHNYVLLEAYALLQARLGVNAAMRLAKDSRAFTVHWVDEELHATGIRAFERSRKRDISLVDQISFLVMQRRNLSTAFAFDADFKSAGFRLFEG